MIMILKKLKIVSGYKFKRSNYSGFFICEKVCHYCDNNLENNINVRLACDKIYLSCSILKNYCYIFL